MINIKKIMNFFTVEQEHSFKSLKKCKGDYLPLSKVTRKTIIY